MSNKIISNLPPKGTADWFPSEFSIRKHIFDTWRSVCLRYGFLEYLSPLVELADIYRLKSGEDIGGKELMTFTDLAGRELCIRPEMTPSVTRMVSRIYASSPKPLKLFSIANFMRNEKPQRGRNREFWQLNCDIFGSASIAADLEILQLSLDIMRELGAPEKSFTLRLNSRKLLEEIARNYQIGEKKMQSFFRILDKYNKLTKTEFLKRLIDLQISQSQAKEIESFMAGYHLDLMSKYLLKNQNLNQAKKEIDFVIDRLNLLGYGQEIVFDPSIIRGFDYYDGLIFEVFDTHENNLRAMFGGGRYNGLAEIFGADSFPAVGFAPGDETIKLFLETWGLLDKISNKEDSLIYFPLLSAELLVEAQRLASQLRRAGKKVLLSFEPQRISKALDSANKLSCKQVIILGIDEKDKGIYKIKDLKNGKETKYSL
jgi:histidyl-tRNA synthetase